VETGVTQDPLELVPEEFRQFLDIMGKEAADALLEHTGYDHAIALKEGNFFYPLSEVELETLRE